MTKLSLSFYDIFNFINLSLELTGHEDCTLKFFVNIVDFFLFKFVELKSKFIVKKCHTNEKPDR